MSPLPSWLHSHLHAAESPRYTFESFADEVARLLGLPPTMRTGEFERSSETDHVWLLWKPDRYGAVRRDGPGVRAARARPVPSVPAGPVAAPRLSP
ncbi:hypothetical protein [Streptomyces sp. A30]|uniref:hypothetical protein n=1 Tax=Streptomyces sp. A30 TaxID=2789273 RepID=UPI00397F600B